MNKVLKIIFVVLVVAGAILAAFSDVPVVEFGGLALAFVGAALACVDVWRKSEKKDWKVIVSIVLVAVGAFGLGLAGVAGETVTTIISAVAGFVALILGIVMSLKIEKK